MMRGVRVHRQLTWAIRHLSKTSEKCLATVTIQPFARFPLSVRPVNRWYTTAAEVKGEYVQASPYGTIEIPRVSLHEYIWRDSHRWEDKTAVECGVTGRSYTYGQLKKLCRAFAASMQNRFGLKKGDCIALVLPNLPEYPVIILGASEAGLISSTVNPIYTPGEIAKQLNDSNAKVVITVGEKFANVAAAMKITKKEVPIVVVDEAVPPGAVAFPELLDPARCGSFETTPVAHDDTIVLPYSSGTTGLPKGVELTHHNLVANIEQMKHPGVRMLLHTTDTVQDVVLAVLPMYHIYGMVIVMMTTLEGGGKLVTVPKFDPATFLQALVQQKVSLLYLVPPLILFLAGQPVVTPAHLSSVRVVNSGAAPLGQQDMERLLAKGPHLMLAQGYGLTEASPCVLNTHKSRISKYSSTGVPLPSTWCKIVDMETRHALPAGKVGELLVQGPQVMKGYYNKPDANKETFEDGWMRTGDIGYYDEEGDFFIVDRIKELIKVKGLQVAPAELEELLRTHPKILEAAVIGVPDARAGELPRAFVVLRPGESATKEEVQQFVAQQVSEHKRLEGGVTFLEAIPKSAAGKILRRELKAKLLEIT